MSACSIKEELEHAKQFLQREMGLNLKYQMKSNVPINFSKDEISTYIKRFRVIDKSNKGYISMKDLRAYLKVYRISLFLSLKLRNFDKTHTAAYLLLGSANLFFNALNIFYFSKNKLQTYGRDIKKKAIDIENFKNVSL